MISNYRMVPYKNTGLFAVQKRRMFFIFGVWSNVMEPQSKQEAETLLKNLQMIERAAWKVLEGE